MNYFSFRIFIFFFLMLSNVSFGEVIENGICKPYFVSIKTDEANMHVGPGKEYKVIFKYIMKKTPLIVTAKYEHWRRVQDMEGTIGWIHKSLLSNKRYVMVKNKVTSLYESDSNRTKHVADLKKYVTAKLLLVKGNWCKIKISDSFVGWVLKNSIFGVLEEENEIRYNSFR